MNKKRMYSKIILGFAVVAFLSLIVACGGGGTSSTTGDGTQYVSDGGSGSKIEIELEEGGIEIPVADRVNFKVITTDPQGSPMINIRIFCESEHGIAILEPSKGGVAFEHTGSTGAMSGVLGGVAPGSYLLECRGPQGFNLVARKSFKVVGEIPQGFAGWPGAAGGNLGGGVITDPVDQDVTVTQVAFTSVANSDASRTGDIDITLDTDCDRDGSATTDDIEPFGPDNFVASFINGLTERIFINSVEISLYSGSTLVDRSVEQLGGLIVAPKAETELVNAFTETASGVKRLVGSSSNLAAGVYNVVFTFSFVTANGESGEVEQTAAIRVFSVNNCS